MFSITLYSFYLLCTGAKVLAIIGIIIGILSVAGIFFYVPICVMMLIGVKKERRGFIIPHLVLTVRLKEFENWYLQNLKQF